MFSGRVHSVTRLRASSAAAGEGGTEVCEGARKARFSLSFVLLLFLLFRRGKKRRGKKRKGREEALVSVSALLFGDWPRDCVAKNAAGQKKSENRHIVANTTRNDLFSRRQRVMVEMDIVLEEKVMDDFKFFSFCLFNFF